MKVHIPDNCGNAPRVGIVADFIVAWAGHDQAVLAEWLDDDVSWEIVGGTSITGAKELAVILPERQANSLNFHSIITHGRLASCDGEVDNGLSFSHAIRFKTTAKSSKIAEIRSYLVTSGLVGG